MKNIIKSALFKLIKEKTFYVTLIIGGILAVLLPLLYYALQKDGGVGLNLCNGTTFLFMSSSPVQNFGITVPVNLSILIVGEFTFGTIRNKIIVGYRKSYVYFSLFLVGVIFTIALMTLYTALSVAISSIIGGFDPSHVFPGGKETARYIIAWLGITACGYIFVTSLCVFFATVTRSQGASIGITMGLLVLILIGSSLGAAKYSISNMMNEEVVAKSPTILVWFIPLYYQSVTAVGSALNVQLTTFMRPECLAGAILSPLIYSVILYTLGSIIFSKRDLK